MMNTVDFSLVTIFSLTPLLLWLLYSYLKPKPNFPPGPKGLPIIGSLLDINSEKPWITYQKWARQYGESYDQHPNVQLPITVFFCR
jgi:hypothetical protein